MATRKRRRRPLPPLRDSRSGKTEEQWGTLFQSLGRIEVVLLVGAVLLLMVLMYTIQSILSPFLVLGAIVFLLFPLRRYLLAKNLMWLSITLFLLWFAYTISAILAPFLVSLVLAYILNPAVDKLEQWRIPRWLSALFILLFVISGITLILFFVLPIAVAQFESVLNAVSQLGTDFNNIIWSSRLLALLEQYGISAEEVRTTLEGHFAPKLDDILKNVLEGMLDLVSSLSHLVTQVFYIIIVPFLTFYLLADFRTIGRGLRQLIPGHQRPRVSAYLDRADELIGRYLRGALTVAMLQGIVVALLFWIFGIKNAIVMGLIAGVLDLVPYFGLIITMVIGAIVALFSDPPTLPKVIFAVASIGTLHLLEVTFLSPRIVGQKVGLHPLLIIFSLLVFAYFLGFLGLLIAIPTTALIILFVREWEAGQRGIPVDQYHSTREQ
jgi:predicted PurR-regulated permease PerM